MELEESIVVNSEYVEKSKQAIHNFVEYKKTNLFKGIEQRTDEFEKEMDRLVSHYTSVDEIVDAEVEARIYKGFEKRYKESFFRFALGGLWQIGKLAAGVGGVYVASSLDHSSAQYYVLFGISALTVADTARMFLKYVVWKYYEFSINDFNNEDLGKVIERYFTRDSASASSQHSGDGTGK